MRSSRTVRGIAALFSLTLLVAACGDDGGDASADDTEQTDEGMGADGATDAPDGAATPADPATICDADGLVAAVEGGPDEGTLAGMTDDPVATAASSNPVLTTLVTAVGEANLVDTLNGADALTVFAPTDCAFAALDQATLEAALADPTGLLTSVLGFHVVAGEQLTPPTWPAGRRSRPSAAPPCPSWSTARPSPSAAAGRGRGARHPGRPTPPSTSSTT